MKDDAEEWLKRLVGEDVEPHEESRALPSFMYSRDPSDNIDRIRGMRKADERYFAKKGKRRD